MRLRVSGVEQEARIADPSRREFRKLTDLATLRRLRAGPGPHGAQPPVDLEIDTDLSSPDESARQVEAHFGLQVRARSARYPSAPEEAP